MHRAGTVRRRSPDVEHAENSDRMPRRPRAPLLIGAVFVLLGGIFIGALTTTVMLRTSIGSQGDLKVRDALRLHDLLDAPAGLADPATTAERATTAFAYRFIVGAAALDATASTDDRARLIEIGRWMVDTGAFSGRDDAVSRWAVIAAHCLADHAEAPRTAATCVRDRMPDDVPVPDHARG